MGRLLEELKSIEHFRRWDASLNHATVTGMKWPKQPTSIVTRLTERTASACVGVLVAMS